MGGLVSSLGAGSQDSEEAWPVGGAGKRGERARSLVRIKGCPNRGVKEAGIELMGSGSVSGSPNFPWELEATLPLCALSPNRAGSQDPAGSFPRSTACSRGKTPGTACGAQRLSPMPPLPILLNPGQVTATLRASVSPADK